MKAKSEKEPGVPGEPNAKDFGYFALALVVALSVSFAFQLLPAEGVFVLFFLLLFIGFLTALTHHPHT